MEKKVLGVAWVGQGDFGDEAMAYALRSALGRSTDVKKLTYYQHGDSCRFMGKGDIPVKRLYGYKGNPRWRNLCDSLLLRRFNTIIYGGGSILHSQAGIVQKLKLLQRMRAGEREVFAAAIGVTVGPLNTPGEEAACADFIEALDLVVTRDNHSYELAKSLCPKANLYSGFDISMALSALCPEDFPEDIERGRSNTVGVFLIVKAKDYHAQDFDENILQPYCSLLRYILGTGATLKPFVLYVGDDYPDILLHKRLVAQVEGLGWDDVHVYDGNIFRTVEAMRFCNRIVSMRYHGIIFAHMLGIPFLSLEYDQKNSYFCRSVGYSEEMYVGFYPPHNLTDVYGRIDTLFERGEDFLATAKPPEETRDIAIEGLKRLCSGVQRT